MRSNIIKQTKIEIVKQHLIPKVAIEEHVNTGVFSKEIGKADVDLTASSDLLLKILHLVRKFATIGFKLLLVLDQRLLLVLELPDPLVVLDDLLLNDQTLLGIFMQRRKLIITIS